MTGVPTEQINPLMPPTPDWLVPVALMFGVLLLAYLGMWRGWRRCWRSAC